MSTSLVIAASLGVLLSAVSSLLESFVHQRRTDRLVARVRMY